MEDPILCLIEACKRLQIPYEHDTAYFQKVTIHLDRPYYFYNNITPFNTEDVSFLCKSKIQSYELLKEVVPMPYTTSYTDLPSGIDIDAIVRDIVQTHKLPIIIKRNAGKQGKQIFLCKDESSIADAIKMIFDKTGRNYDKIALAQDYIHIKKEYRVVCSEGKTLFIYLKDIAEAEFSGNLSPLHWNNAKAKAITDPSFVEKINSLIAPIFPILPLHYGGLDVAEDPDGNLHLIELNTKPGFNYFLRDNDPEILIGAYTACLEAFKQRVLS